MKKRTYIFLSLAVFAALSVTGCKSREKVDLTGIHTTEAETMSPTTAAATEAETKETAEAETSAGEASSTALSVRSKIATEKNGKVSIEYPILSNLPSGSPQDTINALLKEKATQIVDDYELDPENDTVSVKCNIVSLDRSKIVLTYEGSMMIKDAAHPTNLFYTTTVDLTKGILIGLSDYADAYTMAGYILSDDCVVVTPAASKEVLAELKTYDIEILTDILKRCDFSSGKLNGFPSSFSYENQGEIYIAVPVSHALGDYAIVRFSPETK